MKLTRLITSPNYSKILKRRLFYQKRFGLLQASIKDALTSLNAINTRTIAELKNAREPPKALNPLISCFTENVLNKKARVEAWK